MEKPQIIFFLTNTREQNKTPLFKELGQRPRKWFVYPLILSSFFSNGTLIPFHSRIFRKNIGGGGGIFAGFGALQLTWHRVSWFFYYKKRCPRCTINVALLWSFAQFHSYSVSQEYCGSNFRNTLVFFIHFSFLFALKISFYLPTKPWISSFFFFSQIPSQAVGGKLLAVSEPFSNPPKSPKIRGRGG